MRLVHADGSGMDRRRKGWPDSFSVLLASAVSLALAGAAFDVTWLMGGAIPFAAVVALFYEGASKETMSAEDEARHNLEWTSAEFDDWVNHRR